MVGRVGRLGISKVPGIRGLGTLIKGCIGLRCQLPGKRTTGFLDRTGACLNGRLRYRCNNSEYFNIITSVSFVLVYACRRSNGGPRLMLCGGE